LKYPDKFINKKLLKHHHANLRESILVKILISHLTALIKNHWWAFGFEEVFRKFIEGEILEKQGWRVFFVSRKIPQLTVDYLMDQIAN